MFMAAICSCSGAEICPFCKVLIVLFLFVISGIIGYMIGRGQAKK